MARKIEIQTDNAYPSDRVLKTLQLIHIIGSVIIVLTLIILAIWAQSLR